LTLRIAIATIAAMLAPRATLVTRRRRATTMRRRARDPSMRG
jgi:hypothetical protein